MVENVSFGAECCNFEPPVGANRYSGNQNIGEYICKRTEGI